jgi:hypothetical protein
MIGTESKQNKLICGLVASGLIISKHAQQDQQVQSISIKAKCKQRSVERQASVRGAFIALFIDLSISS